MKIQDSKPVDIPQGAERTKRANGNGHAAPAAGAGAEPSAKVDVATAEFDSAKVEAIKQAMREGVFRVNPEAVADRLLESVRELIANKPA